MVKSKRPIKHFYDIQMLCRHVVFLFPVAYPHTPEIMKNSSSLLDVVIV